MSAFVVSPHTMDRALCGLFATDRDTRSIVHVFADIPLASADASEIGRRLYWMNIDAVQQCYPDTLADPANMPGPAGAARLSHTYVAFQCYWRPCVGDRGLDRLVDAYKAMQCLRYQCSEGNVPGTPLYAELTRAMGLIAERIVSTLPAFEAAKWDS